MRKTTTFVSSLGPKTWRTTEKPLQIQTTSSTGPPEYYYYEDLPGPCDVFYDAGCYSFGFNFYTVEFFIVVLLVVLHISMIVVILVQGRQEKAFREAFYVQYVAVSIVDCLRMAKHSYGWLQTAVDLTSLVEFSMALSTAVDNVFPYAQSMLHMLIAVNRFTACFFPLRHSSIWNNRVVGNGLRQQRRSLYFFMPFHITDYRFSAFIDLLLTTVICFLCACAAFILGIVTIVKLRTLARSGQIRETNSRRDATLLLHSVFLGFVELLFFIYLISTMHWTLVANEFWTAVYTPVHVVEEHLPPYRLGWIYSVCGTPFLLLISVRSNDPFPLLPQMMDGNLTTEGVFDDDGQFT